MYTNIYIYIYYVYKYRLYILCIHIYTYTYIPWMWVKQCHTSTIPRRSKPLQGTGESCDSLASSSSFKAHGHPATSDASFHGIFRSSPGTPGDLMFFFGVHRKFTEMGNECGYVLGETSQLRVFSGFHTDFSRNGAGDRHACWHALMATLKLSIVGDTSWFDLLLRGRRSIINTKTNWLFSCWNIHTRTNLGSRTLRGARPSMFIGLKAIQLYLGPTSTTRPINIPMIPQSLPISCWKENQTCP